MSAIKFVETSAASGHKYANWAVDDYIEEDYDLMEAYAAERTRVLKDALQTLADEWLSPGICEECSHTFCQNKRDAIANAYAVLAQKVGE